MKETSNEEARAMPALAIMLVLLVSVAGCRCPQIIESQPKYDTTYVVKTIRDSVLVNFMPNITLIDSGRKWLQGPTEERRDTVFVQGKTKYLVKYKREQKDSVSQTVSIDLRYEATDSMPVVTKTIGKTIVERYTRPWWEWAMIAGVSIACFGLGLGVGKLKL